MTNKTDLTDKADKTLLDAKEWFEKHECIPTYNDDNPNCQHLKIAIDQEKFIKSRNLRTTILLWLKSCALCNQLTNCY